jgi:cellulose synthase/poly-beta-1,6-N-acetylglucosamine synthase-like glycosyltransferase
MTSLSDMGLLALAVGLSTAGGWSALALRFVGGVWHAPELSARIYDSEAGLEPSPIVTAIIPVRNEEDDIGECLSYLASQRDLQKAIVVDDGSTDGTKKEVEGYIAGGPSGPHLPVELLEGKGKEGFGGKPLACQAGAARAASEWLLFIDADTRLHSGALFSALAFARSKGFDAVSGVGEIRCPWLWDKLATPFLLALLNALFRMSDVNDPAKDAAYFYGSFVLIKRDRYVAIGGHASVAGEVVEDKALGAVAKQSGLRIALVHAPGLISAEWAPGLRNWVRALQRVLVPTMRRSLGPSLAFCIALSILILGPPVLLLFAGIAGGGLYSLAFALGSFSFLLAMLLTGLAARFIGAGRLYSVLYVAPAAVVVAVLWVSLLKAWRGGTIEWRGRTVRFASPSGSGHDKTPQLSSAIKQQVRRGGWDRRPGRVKVSQRALTLDRDALPVDASQASTRLTGPSGLLG